MSIRHIDQTSFLHNPSHTNTFSVNQSKLQKWRKLRLRIMTARAMVFNSLAFLRNQTATFYSTFRLFVFKNRFFFFFQFSNSDICLLLSLVMLLIRVFSSLLHLIEFISIPCQWWILFLHFHDLENSPFLLNSLSLSYVSMYLHYLILTRKPPPCLDLCMDWLQLC